MEGRDYVICSICPILKREWDKGKDYKKWRWEGKDSYLSYLKKGREDSYLLFFSIRAKGMERFLFVLFEKGKERRGGRDDSLDTHFAPHKKN